ncbi:P-loop containing nucleoside triphosphate hydrolase protein [Immersiella caudata]|uniref:P-loop containing nucleoside triphosphate hydrolase protein n=1 Tax=Immersiella caudata TaxID=314043 RepID=A0AA40C2P3_9PEZI|nr:P-loop containing nucleoside triphosphate hydrolase protein [Immersiella caudata]
MSERDGRPIYNPTIRRWFSQNGHNANVTRRSHNTRRSSECPQDSPPAIPLPDIQRDNIVIAVMGMTGVGKSTFISYFSKTAVVGRSIRSCTSSIGIHTAFIEGQDVYLIDTPGFDDDTRSDTSILIDIAAWLKKSYDDKVQLAGIVYLHRISDNRFRGKSTQNIRLFKELCGENALSCVVLTTSMWDRVPQEKAQQREKELISKEGPWGDLISHGCRVARQDEGSVSAAMIIRHIISQKRPDSLQIQDEMADGTPLIRTKAGRVLEETLDQSTREAEEQIKQIKEEMERLKAEKAKAEKNEAEARKVAEEVAKRAEEVAKRAAEAEKKGQEERENEEAQRKQREEKEKQEDQRRRQTREELDEERRKVKEERKKMKEERGKMEEWRRQKEEDQMRQQVEKERKEAEKKQRREQAEEAPIEAKTKGGEVGEELKKINKRLSELTQMYKSAEGKKKRNTEDKRTLYGWAKEKYLIM